MLPRRSPAHRTCTLVSFLICVGVPYSRYRDARSCLADRQTASAEDQAALTDSVRAVMRKLRLKSSTDGDLGAQTNNCRRMVRRYHCMTLLVASLVFFGGCGAPRQVTGPLSLVA
jgi:hypothetical protein